MNTIVLPLTITSLIILHHTGARRTTPLTTEGPPPFASDFAVVARSKVFIDKTSLIATFLEFANDACILYTSPRGFGKTTNLDMLRRFFQIKVNQVSGTVPNRTASSTYQFFSDSNLNFNIAEQRCFVKEISREVLCLNKFCGKIPVISLNFANVNGKSYDAIVRELTQSLKILYSGYEWMYWLAMESQLYNSFLGYFDMEKRDFFFKMLTGPIEQSDIENSVSFLCQLVSTFFKEKVILLVDDYDSPLINSLRGGKVQQRVYHLLDAMFSPLFAQSSNTTLAPYMRTILLTGVSPMARATASLKPPLNQIQCWSFLENRPFSSYFGFNEQEVSRILDRQGIDSRVKPNIKKYFNGYRIQGVNTPIYNSYDVIQYTKFQLLQKYRENTNVTHRFSLFLRINTIRQTVFRLIFNHSIVMPIKTNITLSQVRDFLKIAKGKYSDELPWHANYTIRTAFLFFTNLFENGYLNCYVNDIGAQICEIPNTKIENEFLKNLEAYYITHGINFTECSIAIKLQPIVNQEHFTEDMITELTSQLNKLLEQITKNLYPSHEFVFDRSEFLSLIRSIALYNFPRVYFDIQIGLLGMRNSYTNGTEDIVDLIIVNNEQKSVLLIDVSFKQNVNYTIAKLSSYIPTDKQSKVKIFKYMALNVNDEELIEIEIEQNRYTDDIDREETIDDQDNAWDFHHF